MTETNKEYSQAEIDRGVLIFELSGISSEFVIPNCFKIRNSCVL